MTRARDLEISLVNTNNRELLHACLSSIPAACDELDWHATIVDNVSNDGSAEMVTQQFPWADVRRNTSRLGFAGNHNQVIRAVLESGSARYVVLLNEDTVLHPGSLANAVRLLDQRPRLGLVSPRLFARDGTEQLALGEYPSLWNEVWSTLRPGRPLPASGNGWIPACCAVVRSDALREVGPLDERFFIFYEDTDLGTRLRDAGWEIGVCPDASIVHHEHQTVHKRDVSLDMERQMMRSRYLYFLKHYGAARALAVASLCRAALLPRLAKAVLLHGLKRDGAERDKARVIWSLVRYDPRVPLPHERRLRDASR